MVTDRGRRFAPDALIVDEGHPLRGPMPTPGWFVVQDEASQLVALLAGDHPGRRVLDTCAVAWREDDGAGGSDATVRV